jgi:hypothetical protein
MRICDRLVGRIPLLESSVDDMTGAIIRPAAATAAALAAQTALPAPQPQPNSTPPAANATPAVAAPKATTDPVTTSSGPLPPERAAAAQASAGPEPGASSNAFGLDV